MRKFALALAATAMLGMAAPAFAIESGSAMQPRTHVTQKTAIASAELKTDAKGMAKVERHRHGVNKTVEHDRGLHRGFNHSRHYGYSKAHGKSGHAKVTSAQ
jgi:hypothetical protein